jgi:putative ubiquitin-RnfH superfamily antitoxin RatB of RatAB toxin-antitoxin module
MSIELAEKKSHFGDESNESSSMIEVVCARVNDGRPDVQTYRVMQGTTAAAFLRLQGLVAESQSLPVMGVFSQKIAQPEQLYQPLILSPMDVRRARARAHPVGRLMHRRF